MPLSESRQRERAVTKRAKDFLREGKRYLDFAVEVRVIDRDASETYQVDGVEGTFKILEVHRFGGKLDTLTQKFIGPAGSYVVDHCSPQGWEILNSPEPGSMVIGGEGSGKSELAATFTLIQIVSRAHHKRVSAGITAPTTERLDVFREKLEKRIPKSWGIWREKKGEWRLANNLTLKFVGTKKYSAEVGSRIQGYTWGPGGFCTSDEIQDYSPEARQDIESRGRGATNGIFKRFCTATPKDFPDWRDYRAGITQAAGWVVHTIPGPQNIFIHHNHWDRLRAGNITDRDFRRRYLAEELPPESLLYYSFDRARNLKDRPLNTQLEITRVLTRGFDLLIGHDPGTRQDTSILLKAYRLTPDGLPTWWVVGEVITNQSTTYKHAEVLLETIAGLGIQANRALIMTDPHETNQEASPMAVIRQFQSAGLRAERAYSPPIPRKDRIDIVNSLFFSAKKDVRLYIDIDYQHAPCAPHLVRAIEAQVRDESGKAETGRKDESDLTHTTVSLGYGLYALERVSAAIPIETGILI